MLAFLGAPSKMLLTTTSVISEIVNQVLEKTMPSSSLPRITRSTSVVSTPSGTAPISSYFQSGASSSSMKAPKRPLPEEITVDEEEDTDQADQSVEEQLVSFAKTLAKQMEGRKPALRGKAKRGRV